MRMGVSCVDASTSGEKFRDRCFLAKLHFAKSWNKTHALKSKVFTNEIMDQIEMKTEHNIQENHTIDLSRELHGGTGRLNQQSSPQWKQKKLPR